MPGIDLSALTGTELKRLLKAARSRRDGALADRVEWEIASRGAGGASHIGFKVLPTPGADPVVDDPPAEAAWREAEPEFGPEPELELEPEPFAPSYAAERAAPARGGLMLVGLAGLVAGGLITAGAFWALGAPDRVRREPPAVVAEAARASPGRPALAALEPSQGLSTEPEPEPEPALVAEAALAAADAGVDVAARETASATLAPPRKAEGRREAKAARKLPPIGGSSANPCARSRVAADRMVCSDRTLAGLHEEMQAAYGRALDARADPVVVGTGQGAWRRARDEVSDPTRLAQMYDRRIRELNAATAQARSREEPIF